MLRRQRLLYKEPGGQVGQIGPRGQLLGGTPVGREGHRLWGSRYSRGQLWLRSERPRTVQGGGCEAWAPKNMEEARKGGPHSSSSCFRSS